MVLGGATKAAEFTAETVEQAIELGLKTLGVSRDDVEITVLQKEQRKLGLFQSSAVVRLAYDQEHCRQKRQEAEIEQYLTLRYAPGGFTLRIQPVPEQLQEQLHKAINLFLARHHVPTTTKLTRAQIAAAQSGKALVVFEPTVIELDGIRTSLFIALSRMEACFIQYDQGTVSRQALDEAMAVHGIVNGINEAALGSITDGTYTPGLPVVIARGKPPRKATAPQLEYRFEPNEIRMSFREDGSVDFRDVMRLSCAHKGDVLACKGAPTPGEKGWTVTGEEIGFVIEPDPSLPAGANTVVSDDGAELRAAIDGHIEIHNGLICVEKVLVIEGNVDYRVGNIDFDGSVVIGGDVMPEFRVSAKGNIEVYGSVDDATIETDADLVVRYGIFSKGRGSIHAGGDVKAWHFENVEVHARRIYVTSSAINCQLNAREFIEVGGLPGTLVGGVATARDYVYANSIGSDLGTRTEVIVGDTTELDSQIGELKRLIGRTAHRRSELMEKYEQAVVSGQGLQPLPGINEAILDKLPKTIEALDKEIQVLRAELPPLRQARRRLSAAKCHVFRELHDGTTISVFTAKRMFKGDVCHGTVLFDNDRVRVFPFQDYDLQGELDDSNGREPSAAMPARSRSSDDGTATQPANAHV